MKRRAQPRVTVLCGGPSAESAVSRSTAAAVAEALRTRFAAVEVVELDGHTAERLTQVRPDVVFPALHGAVGEDGCVQGMLEVLGLPYVGSGVAASACAMDKVTAKGLFRHHGLPVADDIVVDARDDVEQACRRALEVLGGEVVVKPSTQGSAIGVTFASGLCWLAKGVRAALQLSPQAIVERRARGREMTVPVLERSAPAALPVVEIATPKGSWYDYQHRYTPGLSEHVIPGRAPSAVIERLQDVALRAHRALGCRDLSRADFVVQENGEPVLLEVNTLPGMTPTSLFPDSARAAGIPFEELVAGLVMRAWERHRPTDHPAA